MFLSYNYVPYIEKYRIANKIKDDLSNSYLCYDGNKTILKNIEQEKIIYMDIDDILSINNFSIEIINFIISIYGQLPCPLIYNSLQQKYAVYFVLNNEEKELAPENLKNYLWAKKYYEFENGKSSVHSYFSFGPNVNETYKKFWIFNVSVEN